MSGVADIDLPTHTPSAPATAPQYYKSVTLADVAFEPLSKDNKLYVANLAPRLLVQTPPVKLASSFDPQGVQFVYLAPTGQFARFLHDAESLILQRCLENKAEWFRKDVDDDVLRHNFKSFFKDDSLKVKLAPDAAVFDTDRQPTGNEELVAGEAVRCILELNRVCFGRQEFGALWRIVQAQLVPTPACMITATSDDDDDDDDDADEGACPSDEDHAPRDPDQGEFM